MGKDNKHGVSDERNHALGLLDVELAAKALIDDEQYSVLALHVRLKRDAPPVDEHVVMVAWAGDGDRHKVASGLFHATAR